MMTHLQLFTFMCLASSFLEAQNLVPNGDFETYDNCPEMRGGIFYQGSSLNHSMTVKNWVSPTPGSPDYFNTCNSSNKEISIPENYLGTIEPNSGKAFAGIALYTEELPNCMECKEYLQVKLKEPLKKNYVYEVSMHVSLADNCKYAIAEIGMFLSADSVFNRAPMTISVMPQVRNTSEEVMKSTTAWQKIEGTYVAKGGEQFLTIGNFLPSFKTSIVSKKKKKKFPMAYYFIDDVAITGKESVYIVETPTDTLPSNTFPETANLSVGDHIPLNKIYFETEKADLLPGSEKQLAALSDYLKANKTITIELAGNTDNTGNEKSNEILSEKRAESVYNYLVKSGILPARLTFKGYGSKRPLSDNSTDEGRQKNRRVEFIILTK